MKKLVLMVAMMIAGSAAMADYAYLYWEVGRGGEWPFLRTFDYAQIRVTDQGGNVLGDVPALGNYDSTGGGPITEIYSELPGSNTTLPIFAKIDGYDNDLYGFVVQAYLEDGTLAWTSQVGYYNQLVAANSIWLGDPSSLSGDISPWVASIPEPTSGLLLLLGVAGLALRRRRGEGER